MNNVDGDSVRLHNILGELQFRFWEKSIVPAANHVIDVLMEFAAPEISEVVSGGKNFKTAAKSVGRHILINSWLVVARKGLQAEPNQQRLQNKPVGREETFSQTFFINHVEQFLVPNFCGSFWKSGREGPSR